MSPLSPNSEDPRFLVCEECWTHVFNTDIYENICLGRQNPQDGNRYFNLTHTFGTGYVEYQAKRGCSWCGLVWSLVRRWDAELLSQPITFELSPSLSLDDTFAIEAYSDGIHDSSRAHICTELSKSTSQHDRAAQYVPNRSIQRDVSVEATKTQIQSWIRECASHQKCPSQSDVALPTRLIELRPSNNPEHPRLIISKGCKGKYATLSYCWGKCPQCLLTTVNLDQYKQRLPLKDLSQTLQDAISVAKAIPVDYLWIDALCILQDSPDDKINELPRMGDIYKQSLVTIAAASSADSSHGFLNPRTWWTPRHVRCSCPAPPHPIYTLPFRISKGNFGSVEVMNKLCRQSVKDKYDPINTRAWTLQELSLTQRLLIYSSETLRWFCFSGKDRNLTGQEPENHHDAPVKELATIPETVNLALGQWKKLARDYSERRLSVPGDKLPAFSALAKEYSQILGPQYFAGMWMHGLLEQMCWYPFVWPCWGDDNPNPPTIPYRAPSWSWASTDAIVEWTFLEQPSCQIVHAETTLKSSTNPYGEVLGGHIALRGKLLSGFLIGRRHWPEESQMVPIIWNLDGRTTTLAAEAKYEESKRGSDLLERSNQFSYEMFWLDSPFSSWNAPPEYCKLEHWETKAIVCFWLSHRICLLLELVDGAQSTKNYRRIGLWENGHGWPSQVIASAIESVVAII